MIAQSQLSKPVRPLFRFGVFGFLRSGIFLMLLLAAAVPFAFNRDLYGTLSTRLTEAIG